MRLRGENSATGRRHGAAYGQGELRRRVPQPPLQRYFAIFRRTPSTRYLFPEEIETLRCARQYAVDGFGGIHDWPTTIGGHLGCGLFVAKVMSI
jgi:hypothetical protein